MQKTLLALLFTLLFTGCIERGQELKPAPVHMNPVKLKPTKALSKVKPIEIKKSKILPTPIVSVKMVEKVDNKQAQSKNDSPSKVPQIPNVTLNDEAIFPLSDETKNKISGFFILIIGIIILL